MENGKERWSFVLWQATGTLLHFQKDHSVLYSLAWELEIQPKQPLKHRYSSKNCRRIHESEGSFWSAATNGAFVMEETAGEFQIRTEFFLGIETWKQPAQFFATGWFESSLGQYMWSIHRSMDVPLMAVLITLKQWLKLKTLLISNKK